MMIEDNPDHALLIRKALEDGDCAVTHHEDGDSALRSCEVMRNGAAKPDLVFLDLKLPGMDGFEILTRMKNIEGFKGVPIVMLTTSGRAEEIRKAYDLGANGYVVKPDDFSELKAKLKRVKDYWFSTVELPGPAAKTRENKSSAQVSRGQS